MGLDIFRRFIYPLIMRASINAAEKSAEICKICKGKVENTISYLYLIPVHFSEEHEESAEYYLNNAVQIESTEQIPNGNRACYMHIFQCQSCGHKFVSIVDFLKVRDSEVMKGGDIYPYENFREFFLQ